MKTTNSIRMFKKRDELKANPKNFLQKKSLLFFSLRNKTQIWMDTHTPFKLKKKIQLFFS